MAQTLLTWAALAALALAAGLYAPRLLVRLLARWPRFTQAGKPTPYVRRQSALITAVVFLLVGGVGGYVASGVLHLPLPGGDRQAQAQAHADELFRATPLLRALDEAEPAQAEELRTRYVHALAAQMAEGDAPDRIAAIDQRLRNDATREALATSMARLGNASDEAAARLAQALLNSLKVLEKTDPLLCLGLLHPSSPRFAAMTENALLLLQGDVRKKLEGALSLVLASSTMRPQVAPLPSRADAALAEMFAENLPEFHAKYGGPKEVRALFEALADADKSQTVPPETLCSFAQDLLHALLRMHPNQRGDGLRRLLGAS